MITDENHPRMVRAQHELLRRLGTVLGDGTKPLTPSLLAELEYVIEHHRSECRREKDLDFPKLVALIVPRVGLVEFKRADADIASVRQIIVNMVRNNPHITMDEVVAAVVRAWPDLKPDEILQQHDTGVKANERQAERAEQIEQGLKKELGEDGQ